MINLSYKHAQFYMYFLDDGVSRPPAQFHLLLHLLTIPLQPVPLTLNNFLWLVACIQVMEFQQFRWIPSMALPSQNRKRKQGKQKTGENFLMRKKVLLFSFLLIVSVSIILWYHVVSLKVPCKLGSTFNLVVECLT